MIEKISPIHPDKYPPVIENSDQDLKDICFNKAHEMYGEVLPQIVEDRLNKELHSIISNGYAVSLRRNWCGNPMRMDIW